jgi:hypothetical protein
MIMTCGFHDSEALAAFVTAELERYLPKGWGVARFQHTLAWSLQWQAGPPRGPGDRKEYCLWLSGDWERLLIRNAQEMDTGMLEGEAVLIRVNQLCQPGALSQAIQDFVGSSSGHQTYSAHPSGSICGLKCDEC